MDGAAARRKSKGGPMLKDREKGQRSKFSSGGTGEKKHSGANSPNSTYGRSKVTCQGQRSSGAPWWIGH